MAEFINSSVQTVAESANVVFDETIIEPCPKIRHRKGSGVFTVKGGRYLVSFGCNVAIPTEGTLSPVSLAIALNGEALAGGTMTTTPTAVEEYSNVSGFVEIETPCNCCYSLTIKNTSAVSVLVDNANLVTIREV